MAKELKVGQRVKFTRTHDKNVELTGTIVSVDGNSIIVQTEADGKVVEVSGVETAHADSVTVLSEPKAEDPEPEDKPRRLHRAS
jgi:ribosome maturation factor RimP